MICNPYDIAIVPFPFSERNASKKRPALVLSHESFNSTHKHTVLAMITTTGGSPWKTDVAIQDLSSAGLHVPCVIRMKLFTLDNRLILKKIGLLGASDQKSIKTMVHGQIL